MADDGAATAAAHMRTAEKHGHLAVRYLHAQQARAKLIELEGGASDMKMVQEYSAKEVREMMGADVTEEEVQRAINELKSTSYGKAWSNGCAAALAARAPRHMGVK